MAILRVELLGALRAERDGVPIRFRTAQQGLLVARLVLAEGALERSELAGSLWPETERENGLAYLRRALMELRKAGVEIETPGSRLALDAQSVRCDVRELTEAVQGVFTLLPRARVLGEIDHPAADEVRETVRERLNDAQRRKTAPPPVETRDASDVIRWAWEALLRERPEVVAEVVGARSVELGAEFPVPLVLDLCRRILDAEPPVSVGRVALRRLAGGCAHVLTRYDLAERLYREGLADAEALGRDDLAFPILSRLAFLAMERREWPEARALGQASVDAAERIGAPNGLEPAHTNYAGVLWHLLEFDASARHYRRAIEVADATHRIAPVANLAYLWGVFGVDPGLDLRPDLASTPTDGYRGIADAYLAFSIGMAERDPVNTAVGAERLVELTAKAGMERLFSVAVDCVAMTLARAERPVQAAACARLGSRFRRDVGHRRSPGERLALRRNVAVPLFGPEVAATLGTMASDDPATLGRVLVRLLERA